jgi:hypothetical protein
MESEGEAQHLEVRCRNTLAGRQRQASSRQSTDMINLPQAHRGSHPNLRKGRFFITREHGCCLPAQWSSRLPSFVLFTIESLPCLAQRKPPPSRDSHLLLKKKGAHRISQRKRVPVFGGGVRV